MRVRSTAILLSLSLLCGTGCRRSAPAPAAVETPKQTSRPSAALGLYVSYQLGGGMLPNAFSALEAMGAAASIYSFNPVRSDDTFALLQEYGNLLEIDVPDLLNRSDDRATTLTQYTEALRNITVRALQTVGDLNEHKTQVQKDERQARDAIAALQRQLNQAFKNQDFATAGSLQKDISDAQVKDAQLQTDQRQTQELLTNYAKIITVGNDRIRAIEQNREVLIAGLRVVNLPGVSDLGILQSSSRRSSSF